ncbi:hypothetical protein P691DRAFT_722431 [Macrolepiota fuliginosa MF-IS2]|uniref:Protein-lysine N-methyltransferase EFM6 n=1 Tax=Macrolepiota fuliginosa MF-IS2 TaxID=1400762 RepID=A0A9P5XJQ7_9AGAR|nr:hypothetical protein P691DRAFT_722431 [Macrolepiota fuliginosa MF-IS2]
MPTENPILPNTCFVRLNTVQTYAIPELAHEKLDALNPLRHLIDCSPIQDVKPTTETKSNIDSDTQITEGDQEDEEILRGSKKSKSELLSVLPHQHFSESDGVLDLTFSLSLNKHLQGGKEPQVSIRLIVDAAPGCGGIAWPAGQILSSYLTQTYQTTTSLSNKTIIELGSGTGLVGLIAGKLDPLCTTYITDQAPLLDIMRKNVLLNVLEDNVKAVELNWGEPVPSTVPSKPDIILAADCVYFEPAFPLLVQTLADLSDPSTLILFCYKKRRKADKRFFSLLKKKFTWAEVMDDPNRGIYNREAITLLSLRKIPEKNQVEKRK